MTDDQTIRIGDDVTSKNHTGMFRVIRTRDTVGIMRPEDEMLIQDVHDEAVSYWDTRGNLWKLHKSAEVR